MQPFYSDDKATIYNARAEEVLPTLADNSIDLIVTDPPYHRVKDLEWDRQWASDAAFIAWIGELCEQWRRVLKPNGSLYVFASPQMAARVEATVAEHFNVLNSIRWLKDEGWHRKAEKEAQRLYSSPWEACVFAEQFGADDVADGEAGYSEAARLLHLEVFKPLGMYFQAERERAGLTRNEVEVALGFVSTKDPTRGTALCCRWEEASSLPTKATYERYRALLGPGYFLRSHEELRQQYEELRQQYEELRQQYEGLRRPFAVSASVPYTDVWDFPTVKPDADKHPCEKPYPMAEHIVRASSRPGDTVLDSFVGSGVFGEAAVANGRRFIGSEKDPVWAERSTNRITRISAATAPRKVAAPVTGGLFELAA